MSTANFKLLLHALRLGQAAEPTSAIRALAEEIAAHEEHLERLEKKLAILGSHLQFVEARAARLEAAPQAQEAYGAPSAAPPHPPAAEPQPHVGASPSVRPPSPPSVAPPPAAAQADAKYGSPAMPSLEAYDSVDEDYRAETVVVNRRDIDALRQEAPFQLPPPGSRAVPEARRSIPGAPWARSNKPGAAARSEVHEDYTVDMPGGREDLEDPDDTFRERGGYAGERGDRDDPSRRR